MPAKHIVSMCDDLQDRFGVESFHTWGTLPTGLHLLWGKQFCDVFAVAGIGACSHYRSAKPSVAHYSQSPTPVTPAPTRAPTSQTGAVPFATPPPTVALRMVKPHDAVAAALGFVPPTKSRAQTMSQRAEELRKQAEGVATAQLRSQAKKAAAAAAKETQHPGLLADVSKVANAAVQEDDAIEDSTELQTEYAQGQADIVAFLRTGRSIVPRANGHVALSGRRPHRKSDLIAVRHHAAVAHTDTPINKDTAIPEPPSMVQHYITTNKYISTLKPTPKPTPAPNIQDCPAQFHGPTGAIACTKWKKWKGLHDAALKAKAEIFSAALQPQHPAASAEVQPCRCDPVLQPSKFTTCKIIDKPVPHMQMSHKRSKVCDATDSTYYSCLQESWHAKAKARCKMTAGACTVSYHIWCCQRTTLTEWCCCIVLYMRRRMRCWVPDGCTDQRVCTMHCRKIFVYGIIVYLHIVPQWKIQPQWWARCGQPVYQALRASYRMPRVPNIEVDGGQGWADSMHEEN
jgi:hypothetical protein